MAGAVFTFCLVLKYVARKNRTQNNYLFEGKLVLSRNINECISLCSEYYVNIVLGSILFPTGCVFLVSQYLQRHWA